jgi:hypothetical protein
LLGMNVFDEVLVVYKSSVVLPILLSGYPVTLIEIENRLVACRAEAYIAQCGVCLTYPPSFLHTASVIKM